MGGLQHPGSEVRQQGIRRVRAGLPQEVCNSILLLLLLLLLMHNTYY